jgi:hypothetical protein
MDLLRTFGTKHGLFDMVLQLEQCSKRSWFIGGRLSRMQCGTVVRAFVFVLMRLRLYRIYNATLEPQRVYT